MAAVALLTGSIATVYPLHVEMIQPLFDSQGMGRSGSFTAEPVLEAIEPKEKLSRLNFAERFMFVAGHRFHFLLSLLEKSSA